jgi:hypothetical protein
MVRALFRPLVSVFVLSATLALAGSAQAQSVSTAQTVINYNAGAVVSGYDASGGTAALGLPTPIVDDYGGPDFDQPEYLTPFDAEWTPDEKVGIGPGGSLTLQMSTPIATNGFTLGVHTGIGLEDSSNDGEGINLNPATAYTNPVTADLSVSSNGTYWVDLGNVAFTEPSNYYSDISGPFSITPGSQIANFAKPFVQPTDDPLGVFNGENFAQTIASLNGSAGGTWFDLSGTGLGSVDFVRFTVGDGQNMFVDAVTGIPLPEPSATLTLLLAPLLLNRRRAA